MNIGQAARSSGVSAKRIRYYEQIGVMPLPVRSEGNQRVYGQGDLERLLFISALALMRSELPITIKLIV